MAKKVDSIFLVIEAKGDEFLKIGFGAGGGISVGELDDEVFNGFTQITVHGGVYLICDDCNEEINADETCYYVAVLNRVFCKKCYDEWIASAKYYSEDAPFEERNYNRTKSELESAGLWQD